VEFVTIAGRGEVEDFGDVLQRLREQHSADVWTGLTEWWSGGRTGGESCIVRSFNRCC